MTSATLVAPDLTIGMRRTNRLVVHWYGPTDEVDFLVVKDRKPWFLVEVKLADTRLSPSLGHFQRQTGAAHAFQAVWEADHVAADCFERRDPCVVLARTLLSQLV